ncbi:SDR family oxidoreductase [Shewanella corallii]|uniref:SDR family oxidoreductase n=1 Tax=Shewanella corallii TaxID=560080 RepID=A0ABT0N3M9_9GAMM|nr:SDR family oxidoreductase [Shewanella corallii]MCL2913063.1 SDR family oxidoreductase [Shewanella corallii]
MTTKLIMVTGASADSDIGLAICQQLAGDGYQLILVGRREEALQATQAQLPGEHIVAPMDLTALDDINGWMKSLCSEHGKLSGLVHSASYQGYSPLRGMKSKQIHQYFDTNVAAALMLTAAFSKPQHHTPPASIVHIGSVAGFKGLKGRSLYAASKAALMSITQSCALELADKQIRVNCVAPALVDGAKAQQQFAMLNPEQQQALKDEHPLGLVPPQRVAQAVAYLISDSASHISGHTLPVDGGYLIA